MKTVFTLSKYFYDLLSFPALAMHEFWHIVAAVCVGGKIKSIRFHSLKKARIRILNLDTPTKVRFVVMAPKFSLLFAPLTLCLLQDKMIYFACYYIITIKAFVPSYLDFYAAELRPPKFYRYIFCETYEDYLRRQESKEVFPL